MYYSSDSLSSLTTESLSVTQSLSSLSSPLSSHRMSSSDASKVLLMQHFLKDLTIMLFRMVFHAADTHRATSEGAARKGRLKERCGLEPRTNFFHLRNWQKLVWIRFENIRYLFPHCLVDSMIFGKKVVQNTKCVFWYSLWLLSAKFLILKFSKMLL